ncbi:MAG: GFA family protein, partial [Methyloligellaceae bacterium]
PLWLAYCHCKSCRRPTASPVTLFFGAKVETVRWLGSDPATYESSPGVTRSFCSRCGTPICYAIADRPDELDFYHGTLDRPELVSPLDVEGGRHVFVGEQISWFEVRDALPRYEATSREGTAPIRYGPRPADT